MKSEMDTVAHTNLETYFKKYRDNIVGNDQEFDGPYGRKKIIYADWTASGRIYRPIEERLLEEIGPFVANTHTETSQTGKVMTAAYHQAKDLIKKHVHAGVDDVIIPTGTGMTGAVLKFQRILGLKVPELAQPYLSFPKEERPIVFITHMEHHSNQTSWLETLADVAIINANENGKVCLHHFAELLEKCADRKTKIASITGCSNVTGIETPYYDIARMVHRAGGLCFVDFACSGPYVHIDMHPSNDPEASLDAIFFSPHKFLGGPGTPGVLIFNKKLYHNQVPDQPGGGTVTYTNPWGQHYYIEDIETREDGGTPGFLQTIKAAMAIALKEEMGVEKILQREHELLDIIFEKLEGVANINILAGHEKNRLGVISFCIDDCHYNLVVQLLNDKFGIQTRGGCSCAGTYGHYLFNIDELKSGQYAFEIKKGNISNRPGWVRMSIHPTMLNSEIVYICDAILQVAKNWQEWGRAYKYNKHSNAFDHLQFDGSVARLTNSWFNNL
jgi:selenocysteine lyase/cysteine desulfurase